MPVSPEKWKDLALRGASLIYEIMLEDVYSQGKAVSPNCPYSQFMQDVEAAKAKDKDKKKKRAKAAKSAYLPSQLCFTFDA